MLRLSLVVVVLALGLGLMGAGPAQPAAALDPRSIDATKVGPPLEISGTWLVHEGDDPSYADPKLDDSKWIVIPKIEDITSYFPNADQLWYRAHVHVAPGSRDVGILVTLFLGSYQVFVNGKQISPARPFPPGGSKLVHTRDRTIPVPDALIGDGDLTLAIRARVGDDVKDIHQGGLGSLLLGPVQQLRDGYDLKLFRDYSSNFLTMQLDILLLVIALGLALTMRSDWEYRAMVIFTGASLLFDCWNVFGDFHGFYNMEYARLMYLVPILQNVAELEFCRLVLGFRRSAPL